MEGTIWSFVPAIIAILLALITKQVYVSLFLGIFVGAMFLTDGNILVALSRIFETMASSMGGNGWILIFLVMLGIMVVLMSKAGGSVAYGNWAAKKIKTKRGALLATSALGMLIFVDDYFNCLTVGNVMRPVTDKFGISRAKLAYIIDATAAPVCIIAPISSWAAAVAGQVDGDGFMMFIKTIPFNLYAILTIVMVITLSIGKFDFGKMRRNEANAAKGDLLSGATELPAEDIPKHLIGSKGKVFDLLIPVAALILCCIGSMIFTGYYFDWDAGIVNTSVLQSSSVIKAFGNCNAGLSLAIGSTIAVFITALLYLPRKVLSFKEFTGSFVDGFKSMVPAILILIFAWTLSGISKALGINAYVQSIVDPQNMAYGVLPAIFFIIACIMSFATGTSWGTFGILIPIATAVLGTAQDLHVVLAISAILAGAVYGDHVSPISDTTILASSGAQCNHIDHVNTQLPYASVVAVISFLTYFAAGFMASAELPFGAVAPITIVIGLVLLAGTFVFIKLKQSGKIKFSVKRKV